jgi:hypothetical protein
LSKLLDILPCDWRLLFVSEVWRIPGAAALLAGAAGCFRPFGRPSESGKPGACRTGLYRTSPALRPTTKHRLGVPRRRRWRGDALPAACAQPLCTRRAPAPGLRRLSDVSVRMLAGGACAATLEALNLTGTAVGDGCLPLLAGMPVGGPALPLPVGPRQRVPYCCP